MHEIEDNHSYFVDPKSQLHCLNSNLRKAARVILSLYEAKMRESDLQGTQYALLSAIAALKKPTIGQVAVFMQMDQTTVTRNVNLLKRDGYVQVVRGEDRRTRLVMVTTKGEEALQAAYPMWLAAQTKLWEQLGEDKALQLLEIARLVSQLGEDG